MTNVVMLEAVQVRPDRGSAESRVAVGAALLDQTVPGWWQRVDLETLDICRYNRCVLGQLFGDWIVGLDALFGTMPAGAEWVAAEQAGFWVNEHQPDGECTDVSMPRYAALTEQWRAAVVARRETWR